MKCQKCNTETEKVSAYDWLDESPVPKEIQRCKKCNINWLVFAVLNDLDFVTSLENRPLGMSISDYIREQFYKNRVLH